MPDVPPYPALPGEGASLDTLRHNAVWAKTFEPSVSRLPNTPTSLALRRRQYQDVRDYADALEQERAAAQEERLMEDRNAANYVLRSRAMDMKDRMDRFKIQTDLRKLDNAEAVMPSVLKAREAQIAAAEARKVRDASVAEQQARREAAKDNFEAALAKSDALPDTPEYHAAVLAARNAFPLAEHDVATRQLVDRSRAEISKRAAAREAAAKAAELGLPATGISASGTVTYHQPKSNPELTQLKETLGKAEANQATAKPFEQPKYEPGLKALREKISAIEQPQAPKIDIIEKNGVKYRVDHTNKKVLGIVE